MRVSYDVIDITGGVRVTELYVDGVLQADRDYMGGETKTQIRDDINQTFSVPTPGVSGVVVYNGTTGRLEVIDPDGNVIIADLSVKGMVHADGGDFEAAAANGNGLVVKDKTTGSKKRITVDNGAVVTEDL